MVVKPCHKPQLAPEAPAGCVRGTWLHPSRAQADRRAHTQECLAEPIKLFNKGKEKPLKHDALMTD